MGHGKRCSDKYCNDCRNAVLKAYGTTREDEQVFDGSDIEYIKQSDYHQTLKQRRDQKRLIQQHQLEQEEKMLKHNAHAPAGFSIETMHAPSMFLPPDPKRGAPNREVIFETVKKNELKGPQGLMMAQMVDHDET